jgi:hypothetical protein
MQEALVLYDSIVTSPFFATISVILFLNKADLLRKKCRSGIPANMIDQSYPEFTGDPTDWKAVFRFIEKMFLETTKKPEVTDNRIRNKNIYSHMVRTIFLPVNIRYSVETDIACDSPIAQCTAVDQDNMRTVLANVSDIILRGNVEAAVSLAFSHV